MWGWLFLSSLNLVLLLYGLLESSSVLGVWVLLELLSLGGIPLFFIGKFEFGGYSSLFYYLVGAGLSSFFLVVGVLLAPFYNLLLVVSVLLKLGVFPFVGWVYRVVGGTNNVMVWFFSGPLKISFVLLVFGMGVSGHYGGLMQLLVCCSFVVAVLNFWAVSRDWAYIWCHMMLSSSAGLLAVIYGGDVYGALFIYVTYLVWATSVLSLSSPQHTLNTSIPLGLYFIVLITYPGSLAFVYKLVVGFYLIGLSWLVVFFWVVYSILEQLYLLNLLLLWQQSCLVDGFKFWV